MFNSNCASVPLVANVDGNNGSGFFGDGGAWWIVVFVLFIAFGGWGNGFGGFGGGGNNGVGAEIQRGFDNSAVISKLDGISNGLCDGFYAMNNSMLTGFNGINTNIMQTGYGIQQAINADTVAGMQNTNAIQATLNNMAAQNAACCCETRQAIENSTRSILDFLTQDKIATLQAENNSLRLAASQDRQNALLTTAMTAQTQQIVNSVNPTAIPAYVVPNPNAYAYGCGCNAGCGC